MAETELERSLKERCMRYETRISELENALTEVAKSEGAYSQDPLTHAGNTIDNMIDIARKALDHHNSAFGRTANMSLQDEYNSAVHKCIDLSRENERLLTEVGNFKKLVGNIRSTKPDDYSEDFFELLAIRDMISKFDQKNAVPRGQEHG